jgi:hypothetical protein
MKYYSCKSSRYIFPALLSLNFEKPQDLFLPFQSNLAKTKRACKNWKTLQKIQLRLLLLFHPL